MKLVYLESPYAAPTPEGVQRHVEYARACVRDCLARGESPFVSHLLFTQPGILDDDVPAERRLGMEAGFAWAMRAESTVVYVDLGVSRGMMEGVERAIAAGRRVERRTLGHALVSREEFSAAYAQPALDQPVRQPAPVDPPPPRQWLWS